jgi:predicted dehydrogenase
VTPSVLLVGLGAIAMGYDLEMPASGMVLTHAKAFSQHPDFRLAGGVDADPVRCALFETHYGAPAGTDLAGALATTRPDVVVIAVPTAAHASEPRRGQRRSGRKG